MRPIVIFALAVALLGPAIQAKNVTKAYGGKVYAHIMPWFETRESSGNGQWGQHWTMANQNPDVIVDGSGRRQIASFYYPEIGPYGSGVYETIEYQLMLMKYSGIDGVLIDWPGTTNAYDYPKNKANCEAIIAGAERIGLEFAIVYEDHNIKLAGEAGFISDWMGQAQADMGYLKDVYMPKGNYVRYNGAPLLLTFGPQTFFTPGEWSNVFAPFGGNKPAFLTLWYQREQAGDNARGEYPWIYSDFYDGLRNFYNNRPLEIKFGVTYPGFRTFYANGGWGGPTFELPVGLETFGNTLDLAIQANVPYIQIATWNDYGEGTMVEPTREFGNGFLNILQQKQGLEFGNDELELVKLLYKKRMEYKGVRAVKSLLDEAAQHLIDLKPAKASEILRNL